MIFQYTDKSGDFHIDLIEIEADGILEADIIFKEATGIDVVKATHIGCSLLKNFTFDHFTIRNTGLFQ
jgi:hypothetical protein